MKYQLKTKSDFQVADDTLQNVFSSCNIKIQTESVQKLREKQMKEARTFRFLMITVIVVMVLILALPIVFPTSHVTLSTQSTYASALTVRQHHLENDIFYLTLAGDQIDYDSIEIIDAKGDPVPMISVDSDTQTIVFPFDGDELNIIVPVTNGGEPLHLLLSPKEKGR